jgi:hypothetical protein
MIASVQHYANPLHIYCRLCDLGVSRKNAKWICARIEPALKRLIYEKPAQEKINPKTMLDEILLTEQEFLKIC